METKLIPNQIKVGDRGGFIPVWYDMDEYTSFLNFGASEGTAYVRFIAYSDFDTPGSEEFSVSFGDADENYGMFFDYEYSTGIFYLQLISNGELDLFSDESVYINAPVVALETPLVLLSENYSGSDDATYFSGAGAIGYKDVVVADSAIIDFLNRGLTTLTIGANLSITSITNVPANSFVTLMIEQTGAGNFGITAWPANVIFEQGSPSVNKPTGEKFQVRFFYDGTNLYGAYDEASGGGGGTVTSERKYALTTNVGNAFSITEAALGTPADYQSFNVAFNIQNTSSATLSINGEPVLDIYDQWGNDLEGYEIVPYDPLGTGLMAIYTVMRDEGGMGGYLLLGSSGLVPFNEVQEMSTNGQTVVTLSDTYVWSNQSPWGVERSSIFRNGVKLIEDEDFTLTPFVFNSFTLTVPIDTSGGPENIHIINYR